MAKEEGKTRLHRTTSEISSMAKDEAHRRVGVVAAVVLAIIWRVESTLLR